MYTCIRTCGAGDIRVCGAGDIRVCGVADADLRLCFMIDVLLMYVPGASTAKRTLWIIYIFGYLFYWFLLLSAASRTQT